MMRNSMTGVSIITTSSWLQWRFSARMLMISVSTSRKLDNVTTLKDDQLPSLIIIAHPLIFRPIPFAENKLYKCAVRSWVCLC